MKHQIEEQKNSKIEELRNNPLGSKGAVYKKYFKIPDAFLRNTMNKIISECRDITEEKAKNEKRITPKEYYKLVEEIEGIKLV
ncbi:hypothetical protein [uncultured Tenacibaculum sp.]|uniref:hypothetical protein n=1 Tax=uncultured Tenacibaculum sp. TaxID=174713 RepID=UPI00262F6AAA|nr:hypothetical protein [uncultured Tenacibaculum sp.]